jgi:hypothetical protein
MSYLVYIDDVPIWASSDRKHAISLANPYVRDKRKVVISMTPVVGDLVHWVYDHALGQWIEQPPGDV